MWLLLIVFFVTVISYMWIIVIRAELVQVKQRLVDTLLQLQGTLQGLNATGPLISVWFLQSRAGHTMINIKCEANMWGHLLVHYR